MLATPVLRPLLHLLRCTSLEHLVLLFLAVMLSEQENLTCKTVNIELWFGISFE